MTRPLLPLVAGLAALAALTTLYAAVLHVQNAAIVAMTFLLVVLLVAASSTLVSAVVTSTIAMLCFNFFFLPPVRTFTIADPQNWVALAAFLGVSVVASNLSARARLRAEDALARRAELARLYDLSRDILLAGDDAGGRAALMRAIVRRFDLSFVALAVPGADEAWEITEAGALTLDLPPALLTDTLASATQRLEFDARARTYAGQLSTRIDDHDVQLIPLRVGTRPIGLLAAAGGRLDPGTLDAIAGLAALAIERVQMLEERRDAALTRQSEHLKTTLLASLGHDLRTPLTAIRVGVENLRAIDLPLEERREQTHLVLREVERLDRLFQNLLDMARLDAGTVPTEPRLVHPSEIIEAARAQVAQTLRRHALDITLDADDPVRVDPRLTASALARLLENAAQYSPEGSHITLTGAGRDGALTLSVQDEGPGLSATDLPHVFERFYRGAGGHARPSGTGMGLWIARSMLAAEGGEIWAERVPGTGARLTMRVAATPA